MNAVFDKADYEKGRSLRPEAKENEVDTTATEGDVVKRAIQDSLVAGKVGSLNVDPNYLDFYALECKALN